MNRLVIFLIFIVVVLVILFYLGQQTIKNQSTYKPTPTPIIDTTGNILVSSPNIHDQVDQEFQIRGKARIAETVTIRIKDKLTEKVFLTDTTIVKPQNNGQFGDFHFTVRLPADLSLKSGNTLLLEVFADQEDNDTHTVTIPIEFQPLID